MAIGNSSFERRGRLRAILSAAIIISALLLPLVLRAQTRPAAIR